MKRIICFFLMFMMLLPMAASAEQKYYTIGELKDQVTDRWTNTYETKWRTITVDVQPIVPDVEKMPVLKVEPVIWLPEANGEVEWTAEQLIWPNNMISGIFELKHGKLLADDKNADLEGDDYHFPLDLKRPYAAGNDLTVGDMVRKIKEILQQIKNRHFGIDTENLFWLKITNTYQKGTKIAKLPGYQWIDLMMTLRGIPILGHIKNSKLNPQDKEMGLIGDGKLTFTMQSDDYYHLDGRMLQESEVIAEDVPLCSIDPVIAVLEKEINAGHIRAIYSLNLGLALFNEPGTTNKIGYVYSKEYYQNTQYYAVPMWQCMCIYTESAKKQISQDIIEHPSLSMYYMPLYMNAQTGELINPMDNRLHCADYKGYIPWRPQ